MKNEPSWLVVLGAKPRMVPGGLDIEAAAVARPVTVPQNSLVDILSVSLSVHLLRGILIK